MSDSVLPSDTSADASLTQDASELPVALQIPTHSKTLGWQLLLSLAHLVTFMCLITPFEILLPNQIAALDPLHKATLLAAISFVGAVPSLLGNLLGGALSDRTTSRFGRRRPWIFGSALVAALGLALLGFAPPIPIIIAGVVLFQFALNIAQANLTAIVADQAPLRQRATVSAFASLALPLGVLIGVGIISQAFRGRPAAYFVLAAILFVMLTIFVLLLREVPLPKGALPPLRWQKFLLSFVQPLKQHDFLLTLLGRVFVMFGYYVIVNYLLYYLEDAVGRTTSQATQGVAIFQALTTLVLIASAIVSGIVSDRLQRRKPFVIGAALTMALSLLILAFFPLLPVVLIDAAVLGIGFGIFLTNGLALQTQVLPSLHDNGKDLGILNIGSLLPQVLVPIVVGITLALLHSYPLMFLISAVLTILGGLLIIPVKSVR